MQESRIRICMSSLSFGASMNGINTAESMSVRALIMSCREGSLGESATEQFRQLFGKRENKQRKQNSMLVYRSGE